MLLTKKLLTFLHRVFDKDPRKFLALRLGYDGGMTWRVEDATLYTTVIGGVGQNLTVDLSQYTLSELVLHLAGQTGYTVLYADTSELARLSARVLLDGSGDIGASNGDHLYGYTNVLWAWLEASANELALAKAQITEMLKQMSTKTASDMWLDELGGYYGIPRLAGELDAQYGPRIIAEVLRPRGNNVAMEAAIKAFTGQDAKVTDVSDWTASVPIHNGSISHDGAWNYQSTSQPLYGLFDVEYGYDLLNGGDFSAFQQVVSDLIGRLRDAGTHLRALALKGSAINDDFVAPSDGDDTVPLSVAGTFTDNFTAPADSNSIIAVAMGVLSDTLDAPADQAGMAVSYATTYNGLRVHNGMVAYASGQTIQEAI